MRNLKAIDLIGPMACALVIYLVTKNNAFAITFGVFGIMTRVLIVSYKGRKAMKINIRQFASKSEIGDFYEFKKESLLNGKAWTVRDIAKELWPGESDFVIDATLHAIEVDPDVVPMNLELPKTFDSSFSKIVFLRSIARMS